MAIRRQQGAGPRRGGVRRNAAMPELTAAAAFFQELQRDGRGFGQASADFPRFLGDIGQE